MKLNKEYLSILIYIALLLGSGVFSHIWSFETSSIDGRQHIATAAQLVLATSYLLSFGLIYFKRTEIVSLSMPVTWLFVGLLIWCVVSTFIGDANILAPLYLAGLIGSTTLGMLLFIYTETIKEAVRILFWVCFTILIINVFSIGWEGVLDSSIQDVQGVFIQKNELGHFSLLGVYVATFFFVRGIALERFLSVLALGFGCCLLYLAKSMTSNILIILALVSVFASVIIRRYKNGWIYVLTSAVILIYSLYHYWQEFFKLIGKSTSFTGRTHHWELYWELIKSNLLTGSGYGAYENSMEQTYWLVAGPHSGYIQLLYYIGLPGAAIFSLIVIYNFRSWWRIVRIKSLGYEVYFLAGLLTIFLILNITETYMLNRSGLYWPLFVYVTLKLSSLKIAAIK